MEANKFPDRDRLRHVHTLSEKYGSRNEHDYSLMIDCATGRYYISVWRESDNGFRITESTHEILTFDEAEAAEPRLLDEARRFLAAQVPKGNG